MAVDVKRKKYNGGDKRKDPQWERRIQAELDMSQKDISVLDRKEKGEINTEQKYRALKMKYNIERRGPEVLIE